MVRAVRLANGVLLLAAVFFLLMLVYVIRTYSFGASGVPVLFYVVPVLGAITCLALLKLPSAQRVNVALTIVSIVVSVYAVEAFLAVAANAQARETRGETGRPLDRRSILEVVQDLRRQGTTAYPAALPYFFMNSNLSSHIQTLGGVANVATVLCNELGQYMIYQADERGFNNPKGIWRSDSLTIAVVGDSFTHGSCVPEGKDVSSQLRERWPRTLGLGMSSNGPLLELATLREYLPAFKPGVVLWMYYEGNDLSDLHKEQSSSMLRRYMDAGFTQGLLHKQATVDSLLVSWIDAEEKKLGTLDLNGKPEVYGVRQFVTLKTLRRSLNLVVNPRATEFDACALPMFREVLGEAKKTVSSWGGKLYFVYLPSWARYHSSLHRCEKLRDQVLATAADLEIPIIDMHLIFQRQQDQSALFAQGAIQSTHYNVKGYGLVAQTVIDSLQTAKILAPPRLGRAGR